TRSYGDWSSDVCSSDLGAGANQDGVSIYETGYSFNIYPTYTAFNPKITNVQVPNNEWAIISPNENLVTGKWYKQNKWTDPGRRRSEERRVGKGWRSRLP